MKPAATKKRTYDAWMVIGPDGAELDTVRSTRSESIEKFEDRAFHVPAAWAEHRKEGYRCVKVKVST